jgi:lipopolysaccharide export system protein LptA
LGADIGRLNVLARGLKLIALAALAASGAMVTGTADAQTKGPFGGFKHDSKAPIEIVADSLEVQQSASLAIFTGDVVAGQGTLRLTADKLTVTYAAQKSGAAANTDTGAIQRMRADGNVFLSNGSETAQGAWAEYEVVDGVVRMGGSVVLTQGGNAISGNSLVIDLKAGNGRVEGGRVKTIFAPAAEKSGTETPAVKN